MMHIIAITGRNRAGKTTLAKALQLEAELKNKNVDYYPFAQPLKEELVSAGFNWFYLKNKSKKARRLMQAYGDAKRELDSDYFLKVWEERVERASVSGVDFLISDDLYHWREVAALCRYATKGGFSVTVILVHNPTLPTLTAEDLKYDSVKEQQEIKESLRTRTLTCKTKSPYRKKLNILKIVNKQSTAKDFITVHNGVIAGLVNLQDGYQQ